MKRRRASPPVQQPEPEPEAEPSSEPASAEEDRALDAQGQGASASPASSESEDSDEGDRRSANDEQVADDASEQEAGPAFGAALQRILAPGPGADRILGKHKAVARRVQQERAAARQGQQQREERRRLLEKDHVGADAADPAAERRLKKLASRGVVRLFNAVAAQRKSQQEEDSASAEDAKKEKLTKSKFLELLQQTGPPRAAS